MTPGEQSCGAESYHTGIADPRGQGEAGGRAGPAGRDAPTISADEEKSSAIFAAIVTYMKHLGVKTNWARARNRKGISSARRISGSRRPEEPPKPRKGFSLLDATRWNRGSRTIPSSDKAKSPRVKSEKAAAPERKGLKLLERSESRAKGAASGTPGLDPPGVSVTVNPPPEEGTDGELGLEPSIRWSRGRPPTASSPRRTVLRTRGCRGGWAGRRACVWPSGSARCAARPRGSSRVPAATWTSRRPPAPGSCRRDPRWGRGARGLAAAPRSPGGPGEGSPRRPFCLPSLRRLSRAFRSWSRSRRPGASGSPPTPLAQAEERRSQAAEVINAVPHRTRPRADAAGPAELFYQPLLSEGFFLEAELTNIFPSLEEMTDEHTKFLENLKKLRDESDCIIAEIGDVLLARFDGTEGGWFQKLSARFCSRQSFALEQLKAKQRKETRFSQFIQEAESQARCRRLQLKDIIPIEMQRLTKYPLLLENIAKYTEEEKERGKVQRAAECCRQILNHVNQEVREMENLMKLKDYQKRLDLSSLKQSTDPLLSEFKNTDITKRNLVHEGDLTWRVSKDKAVDVHVLLLDDILVLLQRQEERLVLRCHSRPPGPTPETRQVLSPIIKLSSAMTRDVATDRKAFYVIFSWENGAQIYELVAQTVSERKNWCDLINETAGSLKLPGSNRQKPRRAAPSLSAPHSPSYDRERLLSSSENGNSPRETLHSDEREKEGALEGMEFEERGPEKPEKDSERILAELLALQKPRAAGDGGLAAAALERVSELKRLLVGGSPLPEDGDPSSPEDGWHQAPENRGTRDEDKERDAGDGAESEGGAPGGAPNGPSSLDWGSRCPGGAGPGSPLVLTPRQSEDVRRSCQHLEEVVRRLKDMEDDYSQLQQLLAKCSCPPSPRFT
ncbi:unnamed protein product [Eretmochelys imbricata]